MYLGRKKKFDAVAIAGLALTILLHGGVVVGTFLYRRHLEAAEPPPPPSSYVVARLLRLGKPKDDKKLPNKVVPQQATQKDEGVDYTADADAKPNPKKKQPDRDAKLSDRIRRSLDKAELLAQAQQEIDAEGSPDGVAHGTATDARDGDPYMTKIADLYDRHWDLPSIIQPNEARKLYVKVTITIDKTGTIQLPITFDRRSGNAHFDASVAGAWQAIRRIPLPPPDRFAAILANGLRLKLTYEGLN